MNKIRLGDWSYNVTSPNREMSSYLVWQWASPDHNFTVYMSRTFFTVYLLKVHPSLFSILESRRWPETRRMKACRYPFSVGMSQKRFLQPKSCQNCKWTQPLDGSGIFKRLRNLSFLFENSFLRLFRFWADRLFIFFLALWRNFICLIFATLTQPFKEILHM